MRKTFTTPSGERREAEFSDGDMYRYMLKITWPSLLPSEEKLMQVVGLNPSTATERADDPTLRRCKAFAKREGCTGLVMTNLFAFRATDPRDMKKAELPISPCHRPLSVAPEYVGGSELKRFIWVNDGILWAVSKMCAIHVAAWGNHGAFKNRGREVAEIIPDLQCFRLTNKGEPEHPLYMPADQPLIPFRYP